MSTEVGSAYVTLIPSARGFAARMQAELSREIARLGGQGGDEYGRRFSDSGRRSISGRARGMFSGVRGLAATAGIAGGVALAAGFAKSAIDLQGDFEQTMNLVAASTDAPASAMKGLSDLAMKMGADTAFSANDASGAMLELAKAGISTSDIMGGALSGTLTLASAGGTDLATAATIASNAMNTFALKGKDMGSIAAALAGGANASSASVESLGEALSQVGPGATNAGLSLQETVGALSAFDAAGVKGSDAGTSLKTMLARLVPQTDAAREAFAELGLWSDKTGNKLVDQQGNFKSLTEVAGMLAKGMKGMSDAERTAALNDAFGSDASRAAIVLGKEGAAGIRKYIKATQDQGAAQKMADARMKGTKGALERLSGSIDTVKLAFGTALAPAVTSAANALADFLPKLITVGGAVSDQLGPAIGGVVAVLGDVVGWMIQWQDVLLPIAGGIAAAVVAYRTYIAVTRTIQLVTRAWTAAQAALNVVMSLNPIGLVIAAIVGLVAAFVIAYKKSETFRNIVHAALDGVRAAASRVADFFTKDIPAAFGAVLGWVRANWPKILAFLTGPIGIAVLLIVKNWQRIKAVFSAGIAAVVGFLRSLPGKAVAALSALGGVLRRLFTGALSMARGAVADGASALVGMVKSIPGRLAGLAGFFVDAGRALIRGFLNGLSAAGGFISDLVGNVWSAIKGFINDQVLSRLDAAISFKVDWPGPGSFSFNPDIPRLAHGGRATSASVVEIAEGGEPETAFPDSVLSGFLERMTAAATANMRGGGVYALTITNWEEGTGYIEEVAGGVVDDANDLDAQGRRAS